MVVVTGELAVSDEISIGSSWSLLGTGTVRGLVRSESGTGLPGVIFLVGGGEGDEQWLFFHEPK